MLSFVHGVFFEVVFVVLLFRKGWICFIYYQQMLTKSLPGAGIVWRNDQSNKTLS